MKPYKIIKPKQSLFKRKKLIGLLPKRKVPLWFFKNVHTPPKPEMIGPVKEFAPDRQQD
jgi:hypothetical protein